MAGANPDTLIRFFNELKKVIGDDLLNGGIYANKRGYHNKRSNLPASDYSRQLSIDKEGSSELASAIDLTFRSAQASNFSNIALYSRRLYNAFSQRDSRLWWGDGTPIVREFFGNTDTDREVEGYSLHKISTGRPGPATSDSSHLWHIHISFTRGNVEKWEAVNQILSVMLDRPMEEEDMPLNAEDKAWIARAIRDGISDFFSDRENLKEIAEANWRRERDNPYSEDPSMKMAMGNMVASIAQNVQRLNEPETPPEPTE
jgi:hypothetical protein